MMLQALLVWELVNEDLLLVLLLLTYDVPLQQQQLVIYICAFVACHLFALDKCPCVCPVGIG